MAQDTIVSLLHIEEAAAVLAPVVRRTALEHAQYLSSITGLEVYLKQENFQKTGSFKIRGAYNKVHGLGNEERKRGVIAASAGNHAQGVAYAASVLGAAATIVMPEGAPITKITATKAYGAKVVLAGDNYDAAFKRALELQQETGATYIHAFNDSAVIAGQGTIGLEVLEQCPDIDAILVPIGGGGMISGIAAAVRAINPQVSIIGVEAAAAPSMKLSVEEGSIREIRGQSTIADGIAVKEPGNLTYRMVQQLVDEVVTVDDEEIAAAVLLLLERSKMVVEASGAVSLAAVLHDKVSLPPGSKAACIISGGNIDMNIISRIIERGLVKAGRVTFIRTVVADRPGALQQLLHLVAQCKANVITVHHDRLRPNVPITQTGVELMLETRDQEHIREINNFLKSKGYRLLPLQKLQK